MKAKLRILASVVVLIATHSIAHASIEAFRLDRIGIVRYTDLGDDRLKPSAVIILQPGPCTVHVAASATSTLNGTVLVEVYTIPEVDLRETVNWPDPKPCRKRDRALPCGRDLIVLEAHWGASAKPCVERFNPCPRDFRRRGV